MSSMNIPNGQGMSASSVPYQVQTSMNSYASPSHVMSEAVTKPLLKSGVPTNTQYQGNQVKTALVENAHIMPPTMPMNHYNLHNSSNDSSRTGSPYQNQNRSWNQVNVNHVHQNINTTPVDLNSQQKSGLSNAVMPLNMSSAQAINSVSSPGNVSSQQASSSNLHQLPGSNNHLNDKVLRTSTYNTLQTVSANTTIKPPMQALNGSTHLQNTQNNMPPSSGINSALIRSSNSASNSQPTLNSQSIEYPTHLNRTPTSRDKGPPMAHSQQYLPQNTSSKPSYVSFPNQQEPLDQSPSHNQFNNMPRPQHNSYAQPGVAHNSFGVNHLGKPPSLVQQPPLQQPNSNPCVQSPFMPPPPIQQTMTLCNVNNSVIPPSMPPQTSVQQTQVPQNVNQMYMSKTIPPTNSHNLPPSINNSGQMPVPTMNHLQSHQTQLPPSNLNRPQYPDQQSIQPQCVNNARPNMNNLNQQMGSMSIVQQGYSSMWGQETTDLMQFRNILPLEKVQAPVIKLNQHFHDANNCSPECTMTKIPETNNLLQKSRLPLGVLIHPFRDLNHLPVIQCSTIVRCRACRTYINPFVYFVDSKKWKCNLCYRVNELPEEFQYDPVSKSYGDPSRRPEVKSATIEFIAPSEYMLRPPQPAVYLFLLDTSRFAVESRYLDIVCKEISSHLEELPGDARTQVGVICFNSQVHFYSMAEGLTRPHEITVIDINDMFLPCPDNLLVNLNEQKPLFKELLSQLPTRFANTHDTGSALGAALQAAYKLIFATGGRITVFQTCLPNIGPGSLTSREDPNDRSSSQVSHLGPATDFYKRLALDCSGQQIAVDLFLLNSQYADLATLSGISRFSGGCMYHLPLFRADRGIQSEQLSRILVRYLTRKIGFEAVMRVRCTRGMSIHTFHGNFFVRSTDLLSLPNVNPDAGFGMQLSIDESLQDAQTVCLQAALLYTSSKGERRIRVHTLCLPVCSNLSEIMFAADSQCIVGLLAKMAVDRSLQSSLTDARDAFINVCVDTLGAFRVTQNLPSGYQSQGLCVPEGLKLLPLYIHAVMKHVAFRVGLSTRLDDRIFAMCEMKTLPLDQLIKQVYPDFYPLHYLNEVDSYNLENEVPTLPRMQLSAEKLDSNGVFLLDCGPLVLIYIGINASSNFIRAVFGVPSISDVQDIAYEIPVISTKQNEAVHAFIKTLNDDKPYPSILNIIRDNGPYKNMFIEKLVDDRMENSLSYYEFLQHLKSNVK